MATNFIRSGFLANKIKKRNKRMWRKLCTFKLRMKIRCVRLEELTLSGLFIRKSFCYQFFYFVFKTPKKENHLLVHQIILHFPTYKLLLPWCCLKFHQLFTHFRVNLIQVNLIFNSTSIMSANNNIINFCETHTAG